MGRALTLGSIVLATAVPSSFNCLRAINSLSDIGEITLIG